MTGTTLYDAELEKVLASILGHGDTSLEPSPEQLKAAARSEYPGPIQMLNLLKFKGAANYPADHENASKGLSGAQAYGLYGAVAFEQVMLQGGRLTLFNTVHHLLIGADQDWDQVAIMEYPNVDAFIAMLQQSDYRAALVHRDAGLAKTAVLATSSLLG